MGERYSGLTNNSNHIYGKWLLLINWIRMHKIDWDVPNCLLNYCILMSDQYLHLNVSKLSSSSSP